MQDREETMPKFIIERDIPGAGRMTAEQRRDAARESNAVRNELGAANLQWISSYFSDDKIYCVYLADGEDVLKEHARCLGIPATRISAVRATTDPSTAA
jgi:hypothetical protein